MDNFKDDYQKLGYFVDQKPDKEFLSIVDRAYKKAVEMAEAPPSGVQRKWTHASGKSKHLVNAHRTEEVFKDLITSEKVRKCVKEIFGDQPVYVTHSKISYKFPNTFQVWLPHQDSGYKLGKSEGATVSVHLEDIDKQNGALEIFPGSHLKGRLPHEVTFAEGEKEPQSKIAKLPDTKPVAIEGEKGSILCFSCNTVHQSGENKRGGYRVIFIFEVEPTNKHALEQDGRDAIILNAEGKNLPKPLWLPAERVYLNIINTKIMPTAKRILNALPHKKQTKIY